jgi:hypothetical protein
MKTRENYYDAAASLAKKPIAIVARPPINLLQSMCENPPSNAEVIIVRPPARPAIVVFGCFIFFFF